MAATVPSIEPTSIRAGDTAAWTRSLANYSPADGWALTYYFAGPKVFNVVASEGVRDFAITIAATDTATYPKGDYIWEAKVSKAGEVFTVAQGRLCILPNFTSSADVADGFDTRSYNRRVRDALRDMVEGTAKHPEIAYTIFGQRSAQLIPIQERLDALALFESKVAEEEKAEAINRGERAGVFFRFRNP